MADIQGTLGAKLFITDAAIASSIDTEAEFMAQNWTEVALVENFGEFGRQFDLVTFQGVSDGRTRKLKGGFNDGSVQFALGVDLSDAGQLLLKTAAEAISQDKYGFRIELHDEPSSVGGPTTFLFRGLPMSFRPNLGAVNSAIKANATVEVDSDIVRMPPAELYDRFVTGGSLAAYALFNGSDAEAVDPVISANALSVVTGNAGSGDAADASQLIGSTGYTLAAGATVLEARVKVSAITNVAFFFGWTDQKAALEVPVVSAASANTITTNATDAIGFMFDTAMSTDDLWLVGVNNDVDETAQDAGQAPVADTYLTLRIVTNTSGDAAFYINGTQVGSTMTTAARTGVTLYPTIVASARATSSRTLTADYLYLRQD